MKVYKGEFEQMQNKLPRSIHELDALNKHDPERDEISKRLSPDDQQKLMARYGYAWPPK
jgi:hypothetical protein